MKTFIVPYGGSKTKNAEKRKQIQDVILASYGN